MTTATDRTDELAGVVQSAFDDHQPLLIKAGGSKSFLGESGEGEALDLSAHRGVVSYEPGELVLTARAGTPLAEIETLLAESHQALPFEPPHFGDSATLGGTIATGVSGPARPYTGAARDFVLGTRIINGRGEILRFGGEVMRNVAGYDLSRFMAGAFGTLGVLLDISLKVLPQPRVQTTLVFEHDRATALQQFSDWGLHPWPITGAYWEDGYTYLRLAGAESSVAAARTTLGGDHMADDTGFWRAVGELERPVLDDDQPLWRLSVPPAAPALDIEGIRAIDWGGAQRWLVSGADATTIREAAAAQGGHASLYRGGHSPRFQPLPPAMLALQQRLKQSLDPRRILNRGRLYTEL